MKKPKDFASQEYIDDYVNYGQFPKIHDNIAYLIKKYANENEPCIDLGSCTGLLSVRSIACGRSFCVGIEGNKNNFERAIRHPKVAYENFYINSDTIVTLDAILKKFNPTLVIARRSLPEIMANDPCTIDKLTSVLYNNNAFKLIIEGRVPVKNPANSLYSVDEEIKAVSKYYKLENKFKSCAYLTLKD